MTKPRVLRQRSWPGDKADAGAVGENLRSIESAIGSMPQMRLVDFKDTVWNSSSGLTFACDSRPLAVINVHNENLNGSWVQSSIMSNWTFDGRTVNIKQIVGLVNGTRYAMLRFLVIG